MPIIEFQADGGNVMFVGPAAASEGSWPLGLEVDVLYDRADPYRAGLADATGLVPWSLVAGIALLAAFALAVAV
jgi:hypothetical protein